MKPAKNEQAGGTGGAEKIVPRTHTLLAARVFISHCPLCRCEHARNGGTHYLPGCLPSRAQLTCTVVYFLCKSCGRKLQKASRRRCRVIDHKIEETLEELGALKGIRRAGVRA